MWYLGKHAEFGFRGEATLTGDVKDWVGEEFTRRIRPPNGYVNYTFHIPDFALGFQYPDYVSIFRHVNLDLPMYIMFSDVKNGRYRGLTSLLPTSQFQFNMIHSTHLNALVLERLSNADDPVLRALVQSIFDNPHRPLIKLPGYYYTTWAYREDTRFLRRFTIWAPVRYQMSTMQHITY